jgi:hypothetical protein
MAMYLSFDPGGYQGVNQIDPAIGGMLAPLIVTTTVIGQGTAGWTVLAALFLAAGTATPALSRRHRRW